jgi:cell wall-associated NlpC family hydrolase
MGARSRTLFPAVGALALSISAAACASAGGATPRPFPGATVPRPAPPAPVAAIPPDELPAPAPPASILPPPDTAAAALVATALELLGVPYQNGGTTSDGFDCSGFTQYVFARHGLLLPREVREQYNAGSPVDLGALAPGDLLFFETVAKGASHVGIALGGDAFVHAPSSAGVVRVEHYSAAYWARRFVGARRVTSN